MDGRRGALPAAQTSLDLASLIRGPLGPGTLGRVGATQAAAFGVDFTVKPAEGMGLGIFALRAIPPNTRVTRLYGDVRDASTASRSHSVRVPNTDLVIDGAAVSAVATVLMARTGAPDLPAAISQRRRTADGALAARFADLGLCVIANSSRGSAGRANCRIRWFDDGAGWIITSGRVGPSEQLLVNYNWQTVRRRTGPSSSRALRQRPRAGGLPERVA